MAEQVQAERTQRPPSAAPPAAAGGGARAFRVTKPGQGIHVRWASAVGAGALGLGAAFFSRTLTKRFTDNEVLLTFVPVAVLLTLGYLIFWLVGRHAGVVDFMIATEGEMKKVNWSTRKEVWGATKVVIFTVLALAFILAVVDVFFIALFSAIGVLKFDILRDLFGFGRGTS